MTPLAALALGLLAAQDAAKSAPEPERPPNVVFVLADDLGFGDLGCTGSPFAVTPRLDALAAEGTLFLQGYAGAPLCSPSRAAFLTGRHPGALRVHGAFGRSAANEARRQPNFLDPGVATVADLLRGAGYATGHFGKWHLASAQTEAPSPAEYGFDAWRLAGDWDEDGGFADAEARASSSRAIVDATLEFAAKHREAPFYAQVWLVDPHAPLAPSTEQLAAVRHLRARGALQPSAHAVYHAVVHELDAQVGRLVDGLAELGLADSTLVVFTSDNGPEVPEVPAAGHAAGGSPGPFRGAKRSLYEGGIRAPWIVRWPGRVPAGRVRDDAVVAAVDWLPTLAELAGAQAPEGLAGESVADVLAGAERARATPLLFEARYKFVGRPLDASPLLAIRDGRHKLLANPDGTRVELYDLAADPGELANLAATEPELAARLLERVRAWHATLPKAPTETGAGENAWPTPAPR